MLNIVFVLYSSPIFIPLTCRITCMHEFEITLENSVDPDQMVLTTTFLESAEGRRMAVEIIS